MSPCTQGFYAVVYRCVPGWAMSLGKKEDIHNGLQMFTRMGFVILARKRTYTVVYKCLQGWAISPRPQRTLSQWFTNV